MKGQKTNSADVFATCQDYAENSGSAHAGKPVTLIVNGVRNSNTSTFRNILRVIPQES